MPPSSDAARPEAKRVSEGDIAADFVLNDQDGQAVSLPQFRGRRVVVTFLPTHGGGDNDLVLDELMAALPRLSAAEIAVVGVSVASPAQLALLRDAHALTFPLLSDPERGAVQAFGAWGADAEGSLAVVRCSFVLSADAHVDSAIYDAAAQGHVGKLLDALQLVG